MWYIQIHCLVRLDMVLTVAVLGKIFKTSKLYMFVAIFIANNIIIIPRFIYFGVNFVVTM